jgi:hypothetical protein
MTASESFQSILEKDANFSAEDSYHFLMCYQFYTDWNVYDSDILGMDAVEQLVSLYCKFHGKINVSSRRKSVLSIWSGDPLGVFRYRMDSQNLWKEIGFLNRIQGYVVEGAYWSNGFFYRVMDKLVIQLKLYIDDMTLIGYSYPLTKRVSDL